ncbi:MAG: hypothetical protein ABI831_22545 [Betaproteobacteria bacterium]
MRSLGPADVLALWERGVNRHPLDRSALLCAWARPELSADSVADLPLGSVTVALLQLRAASFGARIEGHVDCERCGERLALSLRVSELLQPMAGGDERPDADVAGLHVRTPCLRDLAAVAGVADAGRAARQLLARCAATADGPASDAVAALPDAAMREVETALEALDPNADLALAVCCAACGHSGSAQLDAGTLLWDEIDARARTLLGEVHSLARAYGWTEAEILALGTARRATYLAMVGA